MATFYQNLAFSSAAFNNDSGANNQDEITSFGGQAVSGTMTVAGSLPGGNKIWVSADGLIWIRATVNDALGTWTASGVTLVAGAHVLYVVSDNSDPASTTGTAGATQLNYIYDNITATVSSEISLGTDTGSDPSDGVTNIEAQTITATLSDPLGATGGSAEQLWASKDNGLNWTNISSFVNGTSVSWSTTLTGSSTILMEVRDAAGNVGSATPKTYVIDTDMPATAEITGITDNVGLVQSNVPSDGVTDDTSLTVTGTLSSALLAGETVRVYDGGSYLGDAEVSGQTWSYTDLRTLVDTQSVSYSVHVVDLAGNEVQSTDYMVTIDTVAPETVAEITSVLDNVGLIQGPVLSGDSTDDTSPTVTGTLTATLAVGETVRVYDGLTYLGDATVTGQTWSFTDTRGLLDTQIVSYNASVADLAGNEGFASTDYIVTIAVCFLKGTRLQTPGGEVAVEDLQIGDLVSTRSGKAESIKWIGRRSYVTRFLDSYSRPGVLPIRIARGALDENVPHRDLFVSPEHCMCLDGVLIPARHLVNGQTIAYCGTIETIEYYHIELPKHDVLLAEGAAAESWLDCGNRNFFHNVMDYLALGLPDAAPKSCLPLVTNGPVLAEVRTKLLARAAAMDCEPTSKIRPIAITVGASELRATM